MSRRRAPPAPELEELAAIYRSIDAEYAGHSCEGTSECCRFGITGREPYVTSIELAAIERAVAARGGALAPKRRALPIAKDERTCPLLTGEARCAIYAWRPVGCRTFYCARAKSDAPVSRARLNELVRQVRELADRHRPGGGQGRPLSRAFG